MSGLNADAGLMEAEGVENEEVAEETPAGEYNAAQDFAETMGIPFEAEKEGEKDEEAESDGEAEEKVEEVETEEIGEEGGEEEELEEGDEKTDEEYFEEEAHEELAQKGPAENSELAEMRAKLAALEAQVQSSQPKKEPELYGFVDDDSFPEMVSDSAGMNKFANNIMNVTLQHALQAAQQIAASEAIRAQAIFDTTKKFYRMHKDLAGHQDTVRDVFQDLVQKYPSITIQDLFDKGSKIARKRLKLPEPKTEVVKDKERGPKSFPSVRGGARAPAKPKSKDSVNSREDMLSTLKG